MRSPFKKTKSTQPPCYFCDRPTIGDVYYLETPDGRIKEVPVCFNCRHRHMRTEVGRWTDEDLAVDRANHHPTPNAPPTVSYVVDRRRRPRGE
jgi:hypothetical protein